MNKLAPPSYEDLRDELLVALGYPGPVRQALLIAVDGRDGAGKSSLALWLGWQLEIPVIDLDLFLTGNGLDWRIDDLRRIVDSRLDYPGPLIVEGVLVLEVLERIGRRASQIVLVENEAGGLSDRLMADIEAYWAKFRLPTSADYILKWREPDGETQEMAAANLAARIAARAKRQ